MPSIRIANRRTAELIAQSLRKDGVAGAFASISASDEETPDLSTPGGIACYQHFDDVDDDTWPNLAPMAPEQAEAMVDFFNEAALIGFKTVIVHCSAGVSRSAAVAATMHDALGWPVDNACDSDVFRDGKFAPNMHVYRLMIRALGADVTQDDLESLWRACVESADFG